MMVKDRFHRVLGLSETEIVFRDSEIPSRMANGGVPKFPHALMNRPHQLQMTITFPSELRFARSWTLWKAR